MKFSFVISPAFAILNLRKLASYSTIAKVTSSKFSQKIWFVLSRNYSPKFALNLNAKFYSHTLKSEKVSDMNRENQFAKFTF